jgi:hypothetical protein
MKVLAALVATLCIATCTPSFSAPRILSGQVCEHNVEALTSQIQWVNSLPQAEYAAQRQGKMIFWMHMLGNLSGAT